MGANMATEAGRDYVPAAGHDLILPLYDPIVTLLGADSTRAVLVDQAALPPGHRVLEIGCGTGSLALVIKRLHPAVDVVGLDPDPRALVRARRKAERAALSIEFDRGFAGELPYARASFDRVFSSFMFHHLRGSEKRRCVKSAAFSSLVAACISSISPQAVARLAGFTRFGSFTTTRGTRSSPSWGRRGSSTPGRSTKERWCSAS